MSLRGRPLESREAWEALSLEDQYGLLRRFLLRRSAALRRRYANVVSVGVGWRTRGRKRKLVREVCVRLLVRRKWTRPGRRPGAIPERLLVIIGKGRRRYSVPTDVDVLVERGRSGPQAGTALRDGVVARAPDGSGGLNGSVCCLVQERGDPSRVYALGCHHVFTRSLKMPGCLPQPDSQLFRRGSNARLGALADWANLGGGVKFGLDAALVRLDSPGDCSLAPWTVLPVRVPRQDEVPSRFHIYAPRLNAGGRTLPLRATFVSEQFGLTLPYPRGQVRVAVVYESIAATEPGDSGSALLDDSGTLWGMHFYETGAGRALALPAASLFDAATFSMPIELH